MPPPIAGKHVIIAGAGVSGLAFAHSLDTLWPAEHPRPKVTLYERGPKQVDANREGYSLSIRSEEHTAGLQVLQKLGVLEYFLGNSLPGIFAGKEALVFRDAKWNIFGSIRPQEPPPDGLPVAQMRVMRPLLRQHLIDTLPASVEVHWNKSCFSAEQLEDGKMQLNMEDGSTAKCDFLVVSDGASSKVRASILPGNDPSFAGVISILGTSKFPDGVPPEIHGTWGPVFSGDGNGLFVFDIDHKSAFWQISYLSDKPRPDIRRAGREQELLDEAKARGRAFAQPLGKLLDATDLATVIALNCRDKEPIDHRQLKSLPAVFVGDSNHAVTPFSGSGANMALMDGMELAKLLSNPKQTFESAVTAFDKKCVVRSKEALSASRLTIKVLHSKGWTLWFYTLAMRALFPIAKLFGSA